MQINTRFNLGDSVRVTLGDDFVATVTAINVHVSQKASESYVGYTMLLPEDRRGKGRGYTPTWAYREEHLESPA